LLFFGDYTGKKFRYKGLTKDILDISFLLTTLFQKVKFLNTESI